jgi:hypothetical protein
MAQALNPRIAIALALVLMSAGALAAFVLAAPGSADDGVFAITMRDGAIELEDAGLTAGRQVIEAANAGTEEHEIVVVSTDLAAGDLPVGLHGVSVSGAGKLVIGEDHVKAGHRHRQGVVLGLRPGTSQRFQVDLEPGTYVAFCQTGNHYLAGERASFAVR